MWTWKGGTNYKQNRFHPQRGSIQLTTANVAALRMKQFYYIDSVKQDKTLV